MKKCVATAFLFLASILIIGCTSKRGLIELNTRPPGADVYFNQTKMGTTPLEFEYDFRAPATLKIEKEGYYPERESLCEGWVIREYQKGNYMEGQFVIQGQSKKAWKVSTLRRLQEIKK